MNITLIIFTSATNKSGGARQALYLAEGMEDRGHKVLFFTPEGSELAPLAPGRSFWRILGPRGGWRRQIEAAMPENGPCVVHAFHNAAVKRAAWWGLFWKKRAVTVAHRGVIFRPRNPLPYWSWGVDAFLVNSEECARILRGFGLSSRRVLYVPNAVPDSRLIPIRTGPGTGEALRAELGMPGQARFFFSISGDKGYKGVKELIAAFARAFPGPSPAEQDCAPPEAAPPSPPHLVILGINPALWQPVVEDLRLTGRIHCLDRREDVADFLASCMAFVLPSLAESMPNTLLEAVRMGLPCIGTRVGAVPDILAGEESSVSEGVLGPCGLLVPPGDVPALAEAMRRLDEEPALRQSFAANARLRGESYRPEKRLDRLEAIYAALLRSKGLL